MSRFIAIDVDAAGLFIVAGSARGNAVRVEQALPLLDDPRPLTPDTAPDLAKRVKEALSAARVPPAPVLVCIARDRVVFKDIRHPKTGPAEEPAVVRFQSQRDLAESADTLHLDYVPLPTPPGSEDKRATAVFVKKDLFNAARSMCELAGLKMAGLTPRPYAVSAAVRRAIAAGTVPPLEQPNAPAASLCLWDGGGVFVVFHGEHMVFSRSMSGLALQTESALIGEVKRSIAAFNGQYPRERLDAIYLTEAHSGGGSWAARLQESLQQQQIAVHPFDPLVGQPAADAVPTELRGRFAAAVGLLAARGHGPLPINFVTPRQPRAEPSKARSRVLVGLLLIVLIGVGIGGGVFFLHDSLDRRFSAANARKKSADEDKVLAQKKANKVKALEDYRNRNVNWLDLMYDVTAAFPDVKKVRVKEFDGKYKQAKQEARSTIPGVGATPGGGAPNVAAIGGVKPGAGPQPPKAAPVEAVADLRLELVSASDADDPLVRKLVEDLFSAENKHYAKSDVDWPVSAGGKRQAIVKVELLPRTPESFIRKVIAEFPKKPVQQPIEDQPPVIFDEGDMP